MKEPSCEKEQKKKRKKEWLCEETTHQEKTIRTQKKEWHWPKMPRKNWCEERKKKNQCEEMKKKRSSSYKETKKEKRREEWCWSEEGIKKKKKKQEERENQNQGCDPKKTGRKRIDVTRLYVGSIIFMYLLKCHVTHNLEMRKHQNSFFSFHRPNSKF